jgi:hypothetical protein
MLHALPNALSMQSTRHCWWIWLTPMPCMGSHAMCTVQHGHHDPVGQRAPTGAARSTRQLPDMLFNKHTHQQLSSAHTSVHTANSAVNHVDAGSQEHV